MIIIDMPADRPSQAALVVDGRLEDLLLDAAHPDAPPHPGAISWAKVDRLVGPAAFVKLDPKHQGYLREAKGLKAGQGVLVQVSGHADPGKAIPVSSRILYKTRLVIHTPHAPGINVSRQIRDPDEKARLIQIVESWEPDAAMGDEPALTRYREMGQTGGFIIRSAAREAREEDVVACIQATLGKRSEREGLARSTEPGSTVGSGFVIDEALREWTDPLPDMIAAAGEVPKLLNAGFWDRSGLGADILNAITPGEGDPFDHFGVWDEIDRLRAPRAELPSGGWMAIEATRAIVTVDINTGDGFGGGDAMTANIEAVRELPRQLRLRGLGGQIIVDFAPLKKMHRKKIEEELKRALRRDRIETSMAGWTPLGNMELTRKRERRPLSELLP